MMSLTNSEPFGVTDLRLVFPKEKDLFFKDLTFQYHQGEKILFLGPSGCGKSTLLQVLSGLIPNSIEIPIKTRESRIPKRCGIIFQDPETQFCMPYVDEEIAFVLENQQVAQDDMEDMIDQYLTAVGLKLHHRHQLISTLSGGMKQRLAVASVLALKPDVLFLDEPTALLDPKGTEDLWKTVQTVSKDKTLIIVEHKIDHVIDFVDRIVLFNFNGQIIADGPKEMIFNQYRSELRQYGIWYPGIWEETFPDGEILKLPQEFLTEPCLILKDFKAYRGKQVKFEVSQFQINKGEWVAIVGENGAGKSTFIEGIMDLIKTKGDRVWKVKNEKNDVSFVFQNPEYQFVTDSVEEEMAFGLVIRGVKEEEIQLKVNEALRLFNLDHVRHLHPFQLSIGQKRRLSVASSIIHKPSIILLDEPTFGQDARNTFSLLRQFERMREEGTTLIMVTHEEEIVHRFATREIMIHNGQIKSDERTKRVVQLEGVNT